MTEPPAPPLLHVVLVAPEIPQNTGNVGRLAAFAACRLHLVEPLGFTLDDRHLRRAGMDYWRTLDLYRHPDFAALCRHPAAPQRRWLLTTHGDIDLWDATFAPGDGLIFGSESAGAPPDVHAAVGPGRRLRVPRMAGGLRSLNLATAAGIAVYEALRQIRRPPTGGRPR